VNPKLNFTWEVDSLKQNILTINLTFNEPFQISPKSDQDMLVFHVLEKEIFVSKDFHPLSEDSRTLSIKCRKQMYNSEVNQQLEAVYEQTKVMIKGSVVGSFVINIFLAGSLSYMISMMNSL
jgi:hypothetical protein